MNRPLASILAGALAWPSAALRAQEMPELDAFQEMTFDSCEQSCLERIMEEEQKIQAISSEQDALTQRWLSAYTAWQFSGTHLTKKERAELKRWLDVSKKEKESANALKDEARDLLVKALHQFLGQECRNAEDSLSKAVERLLEAIQRSRAALNALLEAEKIAAKVPAEPKESATPEE